MSELANLGNKACTFAGDISKLTHWKLPFSDASPEHSGGMRTPQAVLRPEL